MDEINCDNIKETSDWRIVDDKTLQYVDTKTKLPLPLVCGYNENYFNKDFYKKLNVNCESKTSNNCESENNFCSLNNKNRCFFDETKIQELNKKDIYNNKIVNEKDEMNRVTMDNILNDLNPEKVMTGRNDDFKVSIVKVNCSDQKSSLENSSLENSIPNIEYLLDNLDDIDDLGEDNKNIILNFQHNQ